MGTLAADGKHLPVPSIMRKIMCLSQGMAATRLHAFWIMLEHVLAGLGTPSVIDTRSHRAEAQAQAGCPVYAKAVRHA
jgi:hypothetical protein|nr:hypothetical protein BOH68_14240 [Cobetia sp. MM1IDA2H-1]